MIVLNDMRKALICSCAGNAIVNLSYVYSDMNSQEYFI